MRQSLCSLPAVSRLLARILHYGGTRLWGLWRKLRSRKPLMRVAIARNALRRQIVQIETGNVSYEDWQILEESLPPGALWTLHHTVACLEQSIAYFRAYS